MEKNIERIHTKKINLRFTRKAIGNRQSIYVSIPAFWAQSRGIEAGDDIQFEIDSRGDIVIVGKVIN